MDFNSKLESLYGEIHDNQNKRSKQITALITELKPFMKDIGDATLLVPLISKYMDLAVKNDDILVKLANLVLKSANTENVEGGLGLSDEERKQLLSELDGLNEESNG